MAIPQEVLDYMHNRVELKIHKIQITLLFARPAPLVWQSVGFDCAAASFIGGRDRFLLLLQPFV